MNTYTKFVFILFLFSFLILTQCQSPTEHQNSIKAAGEENSVLENGQNLSVIQLKTMLDEGNNDILLLDVRRPAEIERGTIPGNKKYAVYGSDDFEAQLEILDRSKTYFVYCAAGGRSSKSLSTLKKMGFTSVYNLAGGFNAWKDKGYPIEE